MKLSRKISVLVLFIIISFSIGAQNPPHKIKWIVHAKYDIPGQLIQAAKQTVIKDKCMNIRIAGKDLDSLKAKALEEGMPYQTLVSSILHKYVTGQLVQK